MRKFLIIAALLGLTTSASAVEQANDPQEIFQRANQSYEKGDWDKALDGYQALIRQGFEGTSLYYNLANTYYRRGERGQSILWYERASQLSPRDSDIQFNLTLARSHIKEFDSNILHKILFTFTDNELGGLTLFLTWVFFGLLGFTIMGRIPAESWRDASLWFSGILLFIVATWYGTNLYLKQEPWAVVTVPPGEVRNGPGLDYAVGFTVPEGSKVLVLNNRPDWVQVGVPEQGLKGWMPSNDVVQIIDRKGPSSI